MANGLIKFSPSPSPSPPLLANSASSKDPKQHHNHNHYQHKHHLQQHILTKMKRMSPGSGGSGSPVEDESKIASFATKVHTSGGTTSH